jgi:Ca-activated chloride channel family protein
MNEARLQDVAMLYWLWAVPALAGVYLYAAWRRRLSLEQFAQSHLLASINPWTSAGRRRIKAALVLCAFAFLVVALARPAWNPIPQTVKRQGRDVVFLLDVSRSMLAEDLAPNRLERAKLAILDAIDKLQGDRVALVAFAGTAVVKCPFTLDYGFFRLALDDIGPESVSRGGTMIGDAIRKTLDSVFKGQDAQFQDIILITDGEDQESFPVEAARTAGERGVRLIAIGLGDENEGRRIPVTNERGERTFLTYEGREIWSKLDADTLRRMVNATPGGRYLNVSTGAIDLGDVYSKLIGSAEKRALEEQTTERYEEKFQIFLAVAFLLLCAEAVVRERRAARTESGQP